MTAQIGDDGLDLLGDPLPELLTDVAGVQPQPGGEWVHLKDKLGFRSIQRLVIRDVAGSVVMATWPAELAVQARYLYGGGLGSALVAAAIERGWIVIPSPHIAYYSASPARRLYMCPSVAPLDYTACWEDEDGFRRIGGNYAREYVEHELWPWLKQRGFADDGDDTVLRRFLDEYLRMPAQMCPGLRFRRVWSSAEAAELGSALAETIRSEFDAVFAVADEPALSSVGRPVSPGLGAPYRQVPVTELSGSRDPFSVDPALVERGLRGHTDTQNELASVLSNTGIEPCRELTQRHCPDDVDQRLQDFPLGADRLRCPASKSVGQPVVDRLRHGVGSVCDYSVVQLVVQLGELRPDLGLVLARDLLAPPLAVGAGLETDHATPAARTMTMGLRVAALPRVIEVDAVFAPATPAHHGRQRTGSLTTWLQEWLPPGA